MPPGEIETTRVREAVDAEGLGSYAVAKRLGWKKPDGRINSTRASRALGRVQDEGRLREMMTYELAVRICEACGIDPVDVGA